MTHRYVQRQPCQQQQGGGKGDSTNYAQAMADKLAAQQDAQKAQSKTVADTSVTPPKPPDQRLIQDASVPSPVQPASTNAKSNYGAVSNGAKDLLGS